MTYQLYYSPGACSLAAHITLYELDADFETTLISVHDGSVSSTKYRAINPKARVPALAIPGEQRVLTELPAILTFLARRHGALLPTGPLAEARAQEWLAWLAGWVHGTGYGLIWRPARFSDEKSHHPALSRQGQTVIRHAYAEIERRLTEAGPWALGDDYSVVDPFLLVLGAWGALIGLDMTAYPAWADHHEAMRQRPAVRQALDAEGM